MPMRIEEVIASRIYVTVGRPKQPCRACSHVVGTTEGKVRRLVIAFDEIYGKARGSEY